MSVEAVLQTLTEKPPEEGELLEYVNKQLTPVVRTLRTNWNAFSSTESVGGGPPVIADVDWWGRSNCNFFNAANGRWYQDAALTKESDDDAVFFQQGVDYLNSVGGGALHFRGNRYFKTIGAQGLANGFEFVVMKSDVSIVGDGDSSCIRIAPDFNTVANGGYGAVFGNMNYLTSVNRTSYRGFRVDHNSDFNQWPGAAYGGVSHPQNTAVGIQNGDGFVAENITYQNHAGVFGILFGTYGFPENATNGRIINCRGVHIGDDPNDGDMSSIAAGATNYEVRGCSVDNGPNSVNWPDGNNCSAFELHGTNYLMADCKAIRMIRLLNLGGDSNRDARNLVVHDCISDHCTLGISLFVFAGKRMIDMNIHDNKFILRPGTVPTGEAGFDIANPVSLGVTDGNGFLNCKIHDNEIWIDGTPTAGTGNSVGIRILGNCDGMQISNNYIRNFGDAAIFTGTLRAVSTAFTASAATDYLTVAAGQSDGQAFQVFNVGGALPPPLTAGTTYYWINSNGAQGQASLTQDGAAVNITGAGAGTNYIVMNMLRGVKIHDNVIRNPGRYGVEITGLIGEITNVYESLSVRGNDIADENAVSNMFNGVLVAAQVDSNTRIWDNATRGDTTGKVVFDTADFPGIASVEQTMDVNGRASGTLIVGSPTTAALRTFHVVGTALISTEAIFRADNANAAFGWGDNFIVNATTGLVRAANGAGSFWGWTDTNWTHNVPNFNLGETIHWQVVQTTRTTDAATQEMSFKPQTALAGATGANRNGGGWRCYLPDATNGGTTHGYFAISNANGSSDFFKAQKDTSGNIAWAFDGVTPAPRSSAYSVANPTTDRALDVTGDTLAQGLAVLGTLIADLQLKGIIG